MLKKEILYSLQDITIIPTRVSGIKSRKECNPEILSLTGESNYLPIVTAPMDSVVGEENYQEFIKNGISPIIPRTTSLETRLRLIPEIFCAFGLAEIDNELLKKTYPGDDDFYVLIDIANGHMKAQLEIGEKLKSKYGGRIHIMGGNIANPETVIDFENAGFEYIRVGIGGGQGCITSTQCGIHYPMASLLSDLPPHNIKIIADGGIRDYADIIKCLALGADYVMMGYTLSKTLEASGDLMLEDGREISDLEDARYFFSKGYKIYKEYHGMSTKVAQAKILGVDLESNRSCLKTSEGRTEEVKIEYTLSGWTENYIAYMKSAMSYTGSKTIDEFKKNAICQLISDSSREKLNK